jgi:hypothetical protein
MARKKGSRSADKKATDCNSDATLGRLDYIRRLPQPRP